MSTADCTSNSSAPRVPWRRGAVRARRFLSWDLRLAILISILIVSLPTVAHAHHGVDNMVPTRNYIGSCGTGSPSSGFCQTDNATLTVYRESSLSSTGRTNIAAALNDEYAPTDLSVSFVSTPSYSGSAETDIIYQQGTVSGTADGIAWCNDAVSSTKCDQHYNRFDSASPSKALACHETGHAVGLTHGADAYPALSQGDNSLGCMTTPVETSDLGTHNTSMINATYPN